MKFNMRLDNEQGHGGGSITNRSLEGVLLQAIYSNVPLGNI